jgi:excisionase family DNA binding protein
MEEIDRGMTLAKACKELQVSRSTLYKLINAGKIKTFTFGFSTRIKNNEVKRFLLEAV